MALSGRVPIKVSLENGPIRVGDPLVPSRRYPGYAAKAVRSGAVVGIALTSSEALEEAGMETGEILCFVNPHTWVAPAEFEDLKNRLEILERRESD